MYYASSKRRRIVPITPELRALVGETADAVRAMLRAGVLPPPTADTRRCKACSLRERCQPEALSRLRDGAAVRQIFDPDA